MDSKKLNTISERIISLIKEYPECTKNYNLLIVSYWNKFEDFSNVQLCTSSESITRVFRMLVNSGEIVLDDNNVLIRRNKEKEYLNVFLNR